MLLPLVKPVIPVGAFVACVPSRSLLRRALGGVVAGFAVALAAPIEAASGSDTAGRPANARAHVATPGSGAKVRGGHRELDALIEPQSSTAVWLLGGRCQHRSVMANDRQLELPVPGGGIGIDLGIGLPSSTGASAIIHEDEADAGDGPDCRRRAQRMPGRPDQTRHRG